MSIGVLNKATYGTIFDRAVQTGQFKKIELANSHEGNFQKLLGNRMDVVLCSRMVGIKLLKRLNAEAEVIISGPTFDSAPSYVMFNRKTVSPELVRRLDTALSAMREDGTLAGIEEKYSH